MWHCQNLWDFILTLYRTVPAYLNRESEVGPLLCEVVPAEDEDVPRRDVGNAGQRVGVHAAAAADAAGAAGSLFSDVVRFHDSNFFNLGLPFMPSTKFPDLWRSADGEKSAA